MELVKQHHSGCLPASVFMLNNNKEFRQIKRLCKKKFGYSPSRHEGCRIHNISEAIELFKEIGITAHTVKGGATFANINDIIRYNKALVVCTSKDLVGHAVAFDGCKVYDPYQPQILSEKQFSDKYSSRKIYYFVIIKVGIHHRFINVFKKLWFESFCSS